VGALKKIVYLSVQVLVSQLYKIKYDLYDLLVSSINNAAFYKLFNIIFVYSPD